MIRCGGFKKSLEGAMQLEDERIYWGRIQFADGGTLFELTETGKFLDLSGGPIEVRTDDRLNHQRVSVLGRMGHRQLGIENTMWVPSLVASKLVTHAEIALRALAISESALGGSAFDNWLRAEKELLGLLAQSG
jgi:hypothetical protein